MQIQRLLRQIYWGMACFACVSGDPFSVIAAGGGAAGGLSDAQNGMSKAYHEYYQKARAGGAKPEESARQILEPAQAEMSKALRNEYRETLTRNRLKDPKTLKTPPDSTDSAEPVSPAADGGFVGQAPAAVTPSRGEARPEVVLDGSQVPREIEFTPAANPSAAPLRRGH